MKSQSVKLSSGNRNEAQGVLCDEQESFLICGIPCTVRFVWAGAPLFDARRICAFVAIHKAFHRENISTLVK